MKLLVIGSGGREHALAWRLAQSPRVETVFVAPGNAGTLNEAKLQNINISTHEEMIKFCQKEKIAFTVVGPEAPLSAGIVDAFERVGLAIFGPTQYAAQLESSKDFAKAFMQKYHIPTAGYQTFSDAVAAHDYVNQKGAPIVIKADGLAAGKGVVVAMSLEEAHGAIDDMLVGNKMGLAGSRVVIEDFLEGEEASFIVMVDGEHVLPMATSQDHKRLLDHDSGPNTGGMGAYSPAPVVTDAVFERVMTQIIQPVIDGMKAEGHAYTGFLYAGLMIDQTGAPFTIEFNCRFGDPETQPIMMRLESDFSELIEAALAKKLDQVQAKWSDKAAVGVVLAAKNYPDTPETGQVITGLDTVTNTEQKVFYAGAKNSEDKVLVSGGRVLCACALGASIAKAKEQAYELVEQIHFDGMQYRHDIADKAIK
ncbi:phosphoribosylamine--glycine ligase [Neisseria sp. Ec49-e6-T10]|uniref:phosphoribosylamine--glycine ligase n=1 Tax=Neisseria sp. Ec49-e6-T10 TaxID=3140744 RepID=UPI003EBC9945